MHENLFRCFATLGISSATLRAEGRAEQGRSRSKPKTGNVAVSCGAAEYQRTKQQQVKYKQQQQKSTLTSYRILSSIGTKTEFCVAVLLRSSGFGLACEVSVYLLDTDTDAACGGSETRFVTVSCIGQANTHTHTSFPWLELSDCEELPFSSFLLCMCVCGCVFACVCSALAA